MWMWIAIGAIAVTAIVTDMISKNKKIDVKRIEAELKLNSKNSKIMNVKMRNYA